MSSFLSSAPPLYRACVGLALFNRVGLVFAATRIDTKGEAWQMPQGGIDKDESPRQAALRELAEEIGTDKAEIIAEAPGWLSYDFPLDAQRRWNGKFRGQAQHWFALSFTGKDSDIDLATDHPEFSTWKWTTLETLVELIVPFKRPVYRAVADEFAPIARRLAKKSG